MGDPHRPWIYLLMACLLILTAVLTGFERALQSLDKASLEKEEQSGEGSETVEILLHILRNPKRFYCVRQTVSVSLGFVLCLILPMFDFKWLWQEILAVLALCTEKQRERFLLHALYDLSYEEVGKICGCSKSSVQASIDAVRKIFQKFWK